MYAKSVQSVTVERNPIIKNHMALGKAILVASEAVTALLQRVGAEMDYWFDVCHVTEGGNIEQL